MKNEWLSMRKFFLFFSIIIFFWDLKISAQLKNSNEIQIDLEFKMYWKNFQQAVKKGDKLALAEMINFETFNEKKEDFIKNYNKNEPIFGVKRKQILKMKIEEFKISNNGEYDFNPWIDRNKDSSLWNEMNILDYFPIGTEMYLVEFSLLGKSSESSAGTTLIIAKLDKKYLLWGTYFMTYD